MEDLADLAEYHSFLARFRAEEVDEHRDNLLYGDALFRSVVRPDLDK